jgi:hypothetical protein
VEIVLATTASLGASKFFRVINLPDVMMRTMGEYKTHDEFLRVWLANDPKKNVPRWRLSPYGARRLYDLLKRAGKNSLHKGRDAIIGRNRGGGLGGPRSGADHTCRKGGVVVSADFSECKKVDFDPFWCYNGSKTP